MKWWAVALCVVSMACNEEDDPVSAQKDAEVVADAGSDAAKPVSTDRDTGTKPPRDAAVDGGRDVRDASPAQDADAQAAPPDSGRTPDPADASYGGADRCATAGLAFCDDFEGSAIGDGWGNKQGTVDIDGTKAMRGSKSLHAHTVNNGASIIAHRASFPFASERFWVRMFVNFKNLPKPDWAHWSVMWTIPEGPQWSVVEHRVGGQNTTDGKLYWGVGSDHGSSGDWTNIDTSSVVKLDTWQCLEFFIDSGADVSKVFREGVEVPGLGTTLNVKHEGTKKNAPYDLPPMRAIYVGFFYYQGETPGQSYDVWIDSFAVDGERIGCTR